MKINQSTLEEHGKGYHLIHFPSGTIKFKLFFFFILWIEEKVQFYLYLGQQRPFRCAKKPKSFVQKYSLDQPRLALQFFYDKSETPLKIRGSQVRDNVLYFNSIKKGLTVFSGSELDTVHRFLVFSFLQLTDRKPKKININ